MYQSIKQYVCLPAGAESEGRLSKARKEYVLDTVVVNIVGVKKVCSTLGMFWNARYGTWVVTDYNNQDWAYWA